MRFLGKGSSVLLVHLFIFFWMYSGYILRYFLHFHLWSWCSSFTSEETFFRMKVNVRNQWGFLDAAAMCCSYSWNETGLSIRQVCQVLYKLSLEVMSALIGLKYLAWTSIIDCIRGPFIFAESIRYTTLCTALSKGESLYCHNSTSAPRSGICGEMYSPLCNRVSVDHKIHSLHGCYLFNYISRSFFSC